MVAVVQQLLHGPILGHRHRDARRGEAGLGHPTGHHGPTKGATAGCEHAEGTQHPTKGLEGWRTAAVPEATGSAPLLLLLLSVQGLAQVRADFLTALQGGGIGREAHPQGGEGKGKSTVPQLFLQQVNGLPTPAVAAEDPHRYAPFSFCQHRSQCRHDGCGHMSPQSGGANQQRLTAVNGLAQVFRAAELTVDALHPHARLGDALPQSRGHGGSVAIGAGKQQCHTQGGALLSLAPAAIVIEKAAPALADHGSMPRRHGLDGELLQAIHHVVHLLGHGGHQAVVVEATVFLMETAVGFLQFLRADMGPEKFAAEENPVTILMGQEPAGPAGRGCRTQPQLPMVIWFTHGHPVFRTDHPQWGHRWRRAQVR